MNPTLSLRMNVQVSRISRRITYIILAVMLLMLANSLIDLLFPQIAHAGITDISEVCDTNYQLPDMANSTRKYDGQFSTGGAQKLYVVPSDTTYIGSGATANAYGTGGYSWSTYATSICQPGDMAISMTTVVAGFALSILVSMSIMLGALLQTSYTADISNYFLQQGQLLNILKGVSDELYKEWMIGILTLAIGGTVVMIAKRNIGRAIGTWVWVGLCSALIVTVATTPMLANLGGKVNSITAAGQSAAINIFMQDDTCSDSQEAGEIKKATSCLAMRMTNDFIDPVWEVGSAGSLANVSPQGFTNNEDKNSDQKYVLQEAVPGSYIHFNPEGDDVSDDKKKELASIQLPPRGVVPTDNDNGNPTTAEYLRWTQTYTSAEVKFLKDPANAGARCRHSTSPNLDDLKGLAADSDGGKGTSGELCVKKWAVRAAILYGMKISDPSAYGAATGRDDLNSRIAPAVISYPVTAFAQSAVGLNGVLVLYYQGVMLMYLLFAILYLLKAMFSGWRVMLDWFGKIFASAVNRIYLGFMLGLTLILFMAVQKVSVSQALSGYGATNIVLQSMVQQIFLAVLSIALFVVWYRTRKKVLGKVRYGGSGKTLNDYASNPVAQRITDTGKRIANAGLATGTGFATGGAPGAAIGGLGALVASPNTSAAKTYKRAVHSSTALNQRSANIQAGQAEALEHLQNAQDKKQENSNLLFEAGTFDQSAQVAKAEGQNAEQLAQAASESATGLRSQADTKQAQADTAKEKAREQFENTVLYQQPQAQELKKKSEVASRREAITGKDLDRKEGKLDKFLTENNLTLTHEIDDRTGELKVTDLKTGEVSRTSDTSQYNPDLDPKAVFTKTDENGNEMNISQDYYKVFNAVGQAESAHALAQAQYDTAAGDYETIINREMKKVAGMSDADIKAQYGSDPTVVKQLQTWRNTQAHAQRLQTAAAELNTQAAQKDKEAAGYKKEATGHYQKEAAYRGQAQTTQAKVEKNQQKIEQHFEKARIADEKVRNAKRSGANVVLKGFGTSSRRK